MHACSVCIHHYHYKLGIFIHAPRYVATYPLIVFFSTTNINSCVGNVIKEMKNSKTARVH